MDDLKGSSNLLDLVKAYKGTTNTTMKAYYSFLDNGTKREPVEEVIDFIKDWIVVSGVLSKPVATFFSESKCIINPLILVITSQ